MDELDKKIKSLWSKVRSNPVNKCEECPEVQTLLYFIDGILKEADRERVEKHLLECSHCTDLVILNNKVKHDEVNAVLPQAPESWVLNAMNLVSEKDDAAGLFDIALKFAKETIEILTNPANLPVSMGAAPVPVRGENEILYTDHVVLSKTFNTIKSDCEIERIDDDNLNIRVFMKNLESGEPAQGLRVNLFNPDQEIASFTVEHGEVCFSDVSFGKYVIRIMKQGSEIGQISLNLKS
jgi:hypothetical protein